MTLYDAIVSQKKKILAFCSHNDSNKIKACLNSYRVEIGSKCVNSQWLGRLGSFYFMLLFIHAHFYFSYYCLLNNIYAWLLQKNTLKNNYWICEWMCPNKWDCSVRGRGGGLGRSQEENPSQSGPSREEGSSEQRPVWWLTKESALGSLQRSGGPRGSLWSVQRQGTVLLSSPTNSDQLETKWRFCGTSWFKMSCTSGVPCLSSLQLSLQSQHSDGS